MSALTGTGALIRLILRRDRFLLPLWILLLPLLLLIQPSATTELFPTPAQLETYAYTLRTPALVALYGPVFDSNLGALSVTRAGFTPVILALVSLLTVIRHTRTEEEAGRRELLGASVVGRHANLAAALVVVFGANLVVGTVVAAGMATQDLAAGGSLAAGLAYASVGCMFATVGAVAAQLTEGAGAARGLALSGLGVAFVLRLGGDVGGDGMSWLSWLSPIGWGQQIRPYADERWWVLVLAAGFVVAFAAAAVALSSRRDVGAGLLPSRPGPAVASPRLNSPLALAFRLHRGMLVAWTAGLAVLGLVLGGVAEGVGDLVADSPELEEIFVRMGGPARLVDAYLAANMGVLALIASGYAIQAGLRMRTEETTLRAEPVLAAAVDRVRWATGHLTFALVGPSLAVAAGGLTTGLAHGLATGDLGRELPRVLGGAVAQLPAVWLLAGIAIALFGLFPRFTAASWGALGLFFFIGWLGPVLQLDEWVMNLSPFTHLPDLPGGELQAPPLLWIVGMAITLTIAGLSGFRRRDVGSA
ncbi:MAG: ABC transporter permease [Actinobacteria bacterium]|nr:ABC transporter permease [Actinomycetota bacterium]